MGKYKVVIVESRTETWEVEADDELEAESIAFDGPHSQARLVDVKTDLYSEDVEEI